MAYLVISVTMISNITFQHCPPDHGIHQSGGMEEEGEVEIEGSEGGGEV
jgi:hypothetical protein